MKPLNTTKKKVQPQTTSTATTYILTAAKKNSNKYIAKNFRTKNTTTTS